MTADPRPAHLGRELALYTAARFALLAVITAALALLTPIPVLVALMIALIVQLPLAMVVFRGQRTKVTTLMAERNAEQRAARADLEARWRGFEQQAAESEEQTQDATTEREESGSAPAATAPEPPTSETEDRDRR